MRDYIAAATTVIVLAILVITIFGLVYTEINKAQCEAIQMMSGMPTTYKPLVGCFIQADSNTWIPMSSWKYFGDTN